MTTQQTIVRFLTGSRLIAVVVYVSLVAAFIVTLALAIANTLDMRQSVAENSDLLDQLKGRRNSGVANASGGARPGSPFLEGPTVTVAGASLLQRVAGAITQLGGNIQSSQVDIQGVQAKDGFVGLLISCEVEQAALQKLLYDLEAGMPYLFIDQLDVQMPQASAATETTASRVRVMLGVSAQWQASKS